MSDQPFKQDLPVQIPDHELIRCVGSGSYGQVWLARNVMGTYRAIKIISRKSFPMARPFDREFEGIKKFEPISRSHPGFVSVLHIGKNDQAGYFYYIMEVADDVCSGQKIKPESYTAKTLYTELDRLGKLPANECLKIALCLTSALGHLHKNGLVHRDIKPSNIIFVDGNTKFADIGLVADIGEAATFVGSEGYIPPEGPGKPTADLYALGKVLYEITIGKSQSQFPELPTMFEKEEDAFLRKKLYDIIVKACELNPRRRFQTGDEMYAQFLKLTGASQANATGSRPAPVSGPLDVAILYQASVPAELRLLELVRKSLAEENCRVFVDKSLTIGLEVARELEVKIAEADLVIPLLSSASIVSEMMAYEIELAHKARQQRTTKPRLLPIRTAFPGPLPGELQSVLGSIACLTWEGPQDDARLIKQLKAALKATQIEPPAAQPLQLESAGGAVPLDSSFYVVRPVDDAFHAAIGKGDSTVLVKGARQMGKTSLLARGLQQAREEGMKVILTDFQKINSANLESLEKFYLTIGHSLADQLDLDVLPEDKWESRRSPNINLERYLRREILEKLSSHLVWGLDEVDRLFGCSFQSEVFGLFRS